MPSRWRWYVGGATVPDRRVVHAVVASWLDDDHHADRKPWSWTICQDGDQQVIDIGLLDDSLVDRLIARADKYRVASAGRVAMIAPLEQVAATTWAQLARLPSRTCWTMEFVSPVTFRRGSHFLPWPAPSPVFGSLRSAWRSFGAPHVGDVTLDLKLDPIVVTAMSGESQTEQVVLRRSREVGGQPTQLTVTGFTGRLRYAVDGVVDPSAVAALVALAPYAGVGAYTTRGFGGVRHVRGGE